MRYIVGVILTFVTAFSSVRIFFYILSLDHDLAVVRSNQGWNMCPNSSGKYLSNNNGTLRLRDEKVEKLLELIRSTSFIDLDTVTRTDFPTLAKTLGREARITAPYVSKSRIHEVDRASTPNFLLFHYGIQKFSMYNPDDPAIEGLLQDMASMKIIKAVVLRKGSELKLSVQFINGGTAVLKPMRNQREYETSPDQFQFEDFERHNAEIAAFHLSRTLGFYMVPPVTGRLIDLVKEIRPLAEPGLNHTFYYSPAGNLCFYGFCDEYCDPRHSFCGTGHKIEVSLMAYLPPASYLLTEYTENPYKSTYSRWDSAPYTKSADYCQANVMGKKPIAHMEGLLNLVDLHIFDFLQGNRDRHTLNFFREVNIDGFFNAFDNGRGFGKTKIDEYGILAPLWQCCRIRKSTFQKFINLYTGVHPLSYYLDESLKKDPLYPIIVDGHYRAVDRRANKVLGAVMECIEKGHKLNDIVVNNDR